MGESTAIAWTDSTVNFWWGCTKVGPGCDHCYAEQWAKRTGHEVWGPGVPRRKIKSAPGLIERLNARTPTMASLYPRVFIQSMSDLFDNEVPDVWFTEAWGHIVASDRLRIQIVTKRVSVIEKRLAGLAHDHSFAESAWPQHAGLIITVVNQEEADRDVPRALALKAKLGIPWLGLSVEPQIGPIDLLRTPRTGETWDWLTGEQETARSKTTTSRVDWVISGGESKQGKDHEPRPYNLAWARSLRDQCAAAGVAYFQKQLGAQPVDVFQDRTEGQCRLRSMANANIGDPYRPPLKDRQAGADPSEWPADLRVQQFPAMLR